MVYYAGVDIGGGSGVKLGLFTDDIAYLDSAIIPRETLDDIIRRSADPFQAFVNEVIDRLRTLTDGFDVQAVGVASTGIYDPSGRCMKASTLPILEGRNVATALQERLPANVTVTLRNDADAGALAVWERERKELLYWAFGGGWGGAWVSAEGKVLYRAPDSRAQGVHPTNEPGSAVTLSRGYVSTLFDAHGFDYKRFEQNLGRRFTPDRICGPDNTIYAGRLVSGKTIPRAFNVRYDREGLPDLHGVEIAALTEKPEDTFHRAAIGTYELFGILLGVAGVQVLRSTGRTDLPIYVGGQIAAKLALFKPVAEQDFARNHFTSQLNPSPYNGHGNGGNANLFGAAYLAKHSVER